MSIRKISAPLLALVVGLALLAPAPALGQGGRLYLATDVGVYVPATDQQLIRVTVGDPRLVAPTANPDPVPVIVLEYLLLGSVLSQTVEPGKSFTYTIDPRDAGVLADPNTSVRHVKVSFRARTEAVEGASAPHPTLTIELINRRTGKLDSFHSFPGFTGGISVAAGDL